MSKSIHHHTSKLVKLLVEYGVHLWVILLIVNAAAFYAVHFFLMAQTCMTPQQITSDNRCLYIWGKQVFQKGDRSSPHFGHPCGTDVTSILPASHIGNQASYMLPNYVANVCTAAIVTPTPKPTSTPSPKPTSTPIPSPTKSASPTTKPTLAPQSTPTVRPTPIPAANSATAPTAVVTFVPTIHPTLLVVSLPTLSPTLFPSPSQIITPIPSQNLISMGPSPTETPVPTPSPTPAGPVLDLTFSIPGIGSGGAVMKPLHTTRPLTIFLYGSDANSYNKTVKPIYTLKTQATYDVDPNSPTYTSFVNHYIDLGPINDANYQIVLKSGQTMPQLIRSSNTSIVGGQLFTFTVGGQNNAIPHQTMLSGDIFPYPNGDNVMDISDYNALVNCFGSKADTSSCPSKQAADLNDDGVVDGLDYNLMELGFKSNLALGLPVPTLIVPTPTPKIITSMQKVTIAPTRSPGIIKPSPTTHPKIPTKAKVAGVSASVLFSKLLTFFALLVLFAVAIFGVYKSKLLRNLPFPFVPKLPSKSSGKLAEAQPQTTETHSVPEMQPTPSEVAIETEPLSASTNDSSQIDKTYFVKIKTHDATGTWVVLTDDNGPVNGFSAGKEIVDGFARIKGVLKTDNGKSYVEISEVLPSE